MKPFLLLVTVLSVAPVAGSADAPASLTRLLRQPTVSASHIAFAYANNIWTVERGGGAARRLTSFHGQTANPRFSPDGKWIAFSAEYAGNLDVYVMPSEGGEPQRLTWHPGADTVQGWTPDGSAVVFASGRATAAPGPAPRFWTVPARGGAETPMALPRAYQGRISPDGARVAYRVNNSWDDERRNYRGGQNRPIWIVDLKTFDLVMPPWTDSKDIEPVWVGGTVYFLSDRDGVSNVWSFEPDSKKLTQVTKFRDFDVKTMDGRADALVFEQAGYIHELDPATGREHIVNIRAVGDFPWMMPRWEDVTARMTHSALSPTGKRVVTEARGEIFTIPAEKGDIRNLTRSSGTAEREPAWSRDGKWVSYFSDKSGEYALVIESQDGIAAPREIPIKNSKHYYTPSWSPDSKKILYTDTDFNVWVMDVASGQPKLLGTDPWAVPARSLNPTWSPDSKWVAFAARLNTLYRAIFVVNVETGWKKQITDGLADATFPVWDVSGKYLWFLASTDFGLRSQWLDMTSYDREETFGLYLVVLKKGEPSPLLPESDEDKGMVAPTPKDSPGAPSSGDASAPAALSATSPVSVTIDFDGLAQRVIGVAGVPQRQYSDLQAGLSGVVYYLQAPDAGSGARGSALHRYKISDRKTTVFVSNVAEYDVSADGRKLLYRTPSPGGGPFGPPALEGRGANPPSLYLVDADKAPPTAGQGKLDVELRMNVDPRAEFTQMFNEGWRNQRDYLYVDNMHGADWPKVRQMYAALLPFAMHRSDLTYLIDMMGSEIAIGHSYVRGGALPEIPPSQGGLLGADFQVDNGRYRITRIYDNESWNPELRAPLSNPGVDVSVGDYVLAVNGAELAAPDNIHRLLDGTANQQTVLTINSQPTLVGSRQITVIPIANEQGLRTRAWVEDNRRLVEKLSDGRLAYVYVPNTGQSGYASFNRYYFAQQDRQGAIIDERFNGGGSAADYIIDVLQRDFDGYFNNVAGERRPFTSPSAGIWGPKVMLVNEMAGSGGDLMPYMFKRRKIGPLVGKRTWGGLVHTADSPTLLDGGTMIAPRGGFFTRDGKWAVENEGVAPDIDIENFPKDVIAGRDPQLERAVQEALRLLKEKPVDRLLKEPPPPTWGKRKVG